MCFLSLTFFRPKCTMNNYQLLLFCGYWIDRFMMCTLNSANQPVFFPANFISSSNKIIYFMISQSGSFVGFPISKNGRRLAHSTKKLIDFTPVKSRYSSYNINGEWVMSNALAAGWKCNLIHFVMNWLIIIIY